MLTRAQKNKIIEGVKIRLSEFKEFENNRNKLIEEIRKFSISILTPQEQEFINKKPDMVIKQSDLNLFKGCFNILGNSNLNEDSIPREYNYWTYKSLISYEFSKRLKLEINSDNNDLYPIIGDDWRDIEKNYPEFYKSIYPLIESTVTNSIIVLEKLEALGEVLEFKSLGLKDLRNYYVELYKICKE